MDSKTVEKMRARAYTEASKHLIKVLHSNSTEEERKFHLSKADRWLRVLDELKDVP